jgi:hypothetical protein
MDLFILNTPQGLPPAALTEGFKHLGNVSVVAQYQDNQLQDAFPLTHVRTDDSKPLTPIGFKVQHLAAWEQIIHRNLKGAIVLLDTVRLVDSFAATIEKNLPPNADICIFSATNLQRNGIHLNGTDWVLLDSDDPSFNNICNAYYITLDGAKKMYARRNEMLNDDRPFGLFIQSVSHRLAFDRVMTYMSLNSTSSKPIYIGVKTA